MNSTGLSLYGLSLNLTSSRSLLLLPYLRDFFDLFPLPGEEVLKFKLKFLFFSSDSLNRLVLGWSKSSKEAVNGGMFEFSSIFISTLASSRIDYTVDLCG